MIVPRRVTRSHLHSGGWGFFNWVPMPFSEVFDGWLAYSDKELKSTIPPKYPKLCCLRSLQNVQTVQEKSLKSYQNMSLNGPKYEKYGCRSAVFFFWEGGHAKWGSFSLSGSSNQKDFCRFGPRTFGGITAQHGIDEILPAPSAFLVFIPTKRSLKKEWKIFLPFENNLVYLVLGWFLSISFKKQDLFVNL